MVAFGRSMTRPPTAMRSSPFQLQYARYRPDADHCCRSPTPSGVSSPVATSNASRKNSSGEPVMRAEGSGTTRSIASVRPSGDHAAPMTSAMSGIVIRSVQLNAPAPLGGVGFATRRGASVGDGEEDGLALGAAGPVYCAGSQPAARSASTASAARTPWPRCASVRVPTRHIPPVERYGGPHRTLGASGEYSSTVGRYIVRRLVIAIPTHIAITFVVFAPLSLAPTDPLAHFAADP